MKIKRFLQEDDASVAVEYVILVAIAAALLGVGVKVLIDAMAGLFAGWGNYFGAAS